MSESEARTRTERIDPKLKAAGWHVAPFDPSASLGSLKAVAVEEFPTEHGPADYALLDGSGVRGVVEAKKLTVGPDGVLTQARRYAQGLRDVDAEYDAGCRAPFLYSTNGERIFFH